MQSNEVLEVGHQLESGHDAEVEHGGRSHEVAAFPSREELGRPHLQLELADVSYVAVGSVEGTIGEYGGRERDRDCQRREGESGSSHGSHL